MKKLFTLFVIEVLTISVFAQSPQKMSYQSVVRNTTGGLVTNHAVGMKISILQGSATGTVVFSETYSPAPSTNANGLVTIEIGSGTPVTGTFSSINWATGSYYLKTEADPAGGTSYTLVGTSQLLSVPYALHAKTVQTEADPTWSGAASQTGDIGRTGNVGIGTSTPSARLDVTGGDALVNELTVGKGGGSQLANTAIGYSALSSNTSGIYNTAAGNAVMYNNTEGNENSAFGFRALFSNTTGKHNTANGFRALFFNTTGNSNTASGNNTLYNNTTGFSNTAFGSSTLYFNTEGYMNAAVGLGALQSNTTGHANTAFGAGALESHTIGSLNTAIGYYSGDSYNDLVGEKNTFIGANTSYGSGTITNSTAIGADVSLTNSNTVILGNNANVGIGTTNPTHKLDVSGTANLNNGIASGVALRCNGAEALWYNGTYFSWGHDASYSYFADPVTIGTAGAPSYTLVVNGTAAKTGGGSWSVLSDFRLKDLTGNYEKGLKEILDLNAVRFTYKEFNPRNLDSDQEQIGFIAQEVQKIFPEAVNQCNDGYLDFNMHPVNIALVNAVKELSKQNQEQQKQIDELNQLVKTLLQK